MAARGRDNAAPVLSEADETPLPQRLLRIASRMFAERGFESTSVQEIVAAAGVTKGAMYHYYASKDDLLVEIYHRMLAMQTERLNTIADGSEPVVDRLREAAADVVVTTLDNIDDAVVYFRSMHLLAPDKRNEIRAERRRYHERFRSLIEQGQREGLLRADVSADIATHNFFGGVHHLNSWYQLDGPMSPREVGDVFADLLLHGLAPTTGER
ncbi:TetR/AcrR family transcriptional regulator [Embleya sp. NPDC008237]|uniref:TetR/AcrR family transcriptional regulator n=1 Tax=Embleya sp. NPDC008237 TaxID=3363978 RepID=UPI0036F138FD